MGRKNKAANVDDPQDEGGANEDTQQDTKTESKEEEKNGAPKEEAPKATPKKEAPAPPKAKETKNGEPEPSLNQPLAKSNRKGSKFDLQG